MFALMRAMEELAAGSDPPLSPLLSAPDVILKRNRKKVLRFAIVQ
jgi:hypothetical protein